MDVNVSDETLKATTKCTKEFECLKGDGASLCKVDRCIDGTVHYIEPGSQDNCPYHLDFGGCSCCRCPIRKELFNKHKI